MSASKIVMVSSLSIAIAFLGVKGSIASDPPTDLALGVKGEDGTHYLDYGFGLERWEDGKK